MATTEFKDIIKIQETSSTTEANQFLMEGWKLIDTYRTSFSSEGKDEVLIYVLGLTKK